MAVRTISSIVFLFIVVPCIYFSSTPLFIAFVLFLSIGAAFEMLKCNGLHKNAGIALPIYMISVIWLT